jgi:hypothetical protein
MCKKVFLKRAGEGGDKEVTEGTKGTLYALMKLSK